MKTRAELVVPAAVVAACLGVPMSACRTDDGLLSTHIGFSAAWVVSDIDDGNGFYASADPVVVPAVANLGVPFPVTIYSFSGGCTWATDSVSVSMRGDTALLIPYDHVIGSLHSACPADLRESSRNVQISFAQTGPATIVVRGWRNGPPAGLFDLTRSTMVNP